MRSGGAALAMRVFLVGVACVGKTTVGAILARRLGCRFLDLDEEVERHFGASVERLQARFLTGYGYRVQAAAVLGQLAGDSADSVVALPPNGLKDAFLRVIKKIDCTVVVLEDTPENVLARIAFFDVDSRPTEKHLTDEEKRLYLREIKKDITFFRKSYERAHLRVSIAGLDAKAAAAKIEQGLAEHSAAGAPSASWSS